MYPHRIRLRGPWDATAASWTGRVTLPVALEMTPLEGQDGEVRLTRKFGYPGRIDANERVWLIVERPGATLALTLNGTPVGECGADAEWDITDRLSARNEIRIATQITPCPPWGEVALEVRRTAFLRGVRIDLSGDHVHASGEVVGHGAGSFDLYLVAGRRTAAYTSISLGAGVTPFRLEGPMEEPATTFRVELMQGAVVWYSALIERGA